MMNPRRIVFFLVITLSFLFLPTLSARAAEPERPNVHLPFDLEQEAKINELAKLPSKEAFERLKDVEFLIDDNLLYRAIFKTFGHRKTEGISLALYCLRLPRTEMVGGKRINRGDSFYVAQRILEVFPDESVHRLLKLYNNDDAVTKCNIINACGQIAGGKPIRDLLIRALDDKTFCEEENPEMQGEPLRICDVAYNQLVLRYQSKGFLRTIGNGHRIEIRDHHIGILKKIMKL